MTLPQARLPNGLTVACANPAEVAALYKQIGPYFRHGITLAAGDTVIDVGANIGLFCLAASAWGAKPLRGVACEPVPAVCQALQANLAQWAPGIQALACAVSDREGTLDFHHYPRLTVLSTAYPAELSAAATYAAVAEQLQRLPRRWRWLSLLPGPLRRALVRAGMALFLRPQRIRCPMRSLSAVITEQGFERIDLLKIDAERAELDVLRGITSAHWTLIRQVVMEVHDTDGRLAQVCALLRAQGFAEPVVEQGPEMAPFGVFQLWARRSADGNFRRGVSGLAG
jgi:31-O-methyltransferase